MPVRKNAYSMSSSEQQTFIRGVEALVANGRYAELSAHHSRFMMHRMHAMTDSEGESTGMLRFLPWHRAYLIEFERALVNEQSAAFIPYWDWWRTSTTTSGIPSWMESVRPVVEGTAEINGASQDFREQANRAAIVNDLSANLSTIEAIDDFSAFTAALETGPHNSGHAQMGGVMGSMLSPVDPMFWLHHAMVDRVWARWQLGNPGELPSLTGTNATMDPWSYTVQQLESIMDHGYSYDDVASSVPARPRGRRRGGGGGGGATIQSAM
jgi:tyrosinase